MPHELSFDIYSQPVSDLTGSASSFSDTSVDLQSFVQSEAPRDSPEREGFITWIDFIDELLKQPMQESSALCSPGIVKRYFGDNSHQNVNSADTFPSIPSAECQSGLEVSVKNNSKRSRPYTRESASYDCNVESIQLDQSSRKRQMASGEDPRAVRTFNTLECSFVDQKQPGNLLVDAKLAPSHSNAGTRMLHNRPNISNAEPFTRIIPSTSPRAYSFSGSFPHSPAASTPSHCSSSTKPAVLAQQSCQFIPSDSFSVSQTASYDEMRSFQQRSGALTTNSIADPKFSSFLTSNPCTSLQDAQAVKVDKSLSVQVESMNATHSNKKILTQRSKQSHDAINPVQFEEVHSSPQQEPSGIQLVHLLLSCAEAISKKSYSTAKENLLQLQRKVLLDTGDSVHRVVAHFTEALLAKINGTGSRSYVAIKSHEEISSEDILAAYNVLYQVCPYMKFGHFTCNQAIFEAFEGHSRVHILDLDILQGYQWPSLIQALATRPGGAPFLRITGVGKTLHTLHETGKRLADLASTLSVPFEFQAVGESLENLHSFMIERAPGEILAVNCVNRLHRLLTEPRNSSIEGVLRLIRDLSPSRVTIVEQEASHNAPNFLPRFLEALHYFSAIFDSLDATLPRTSHDRAKVESTIFSNEITNIVACEGAERIERHEKLETWMKIMESMGFQSVPLSANGINQCKLLLGLYPCDGYSAVEADKDGLILSWQDRAILGVSVWR